MKKRILPLLCALALLFALAPAASAISSAPASYRVTGTISGDAMTVSVRIRGAVALGGRIAIGFNPKQLEFPTINRYFSSMFRCSGNFEVTGESHTTAEYFSNEKGHALIAWYAYGRAIDCTKETEIGSFTLRLKEGVTASDLNSGSLFLYGISDNYMNWDSNLRIWTQNAGDYAANVPGLDVCPVEFSFPGSSKPNPSAVHVIINAQDTGGKNLKGGQVAINGNVLTLNSGGRAEFPLNPGTYTCMISAPGYEEGLTTITARGGSVYRSTALRSTQELVNAVASNLEITFQGDDTIDHVTRNIGLLKNGEQNTTIAWKSSNPELLSEYGNVFRQAAPKTVTLTATVSKDGLKATKTFKVTLTAADVPQTVLPPVTVTNPTTTTTPTEPSYDRAPFTDVASYRSWAGEALDAMYAMGYIQGTDTTGTHFNPAAAITRADFLTLMIRVLQPKGKAGTGFKDVPKNAYYHDAVCLAQGLGLAQGTLDGKFNPTAPMTREDMITLTYRALELLDLTPETTHGEDILDAYPDAGKVSAYARKGMATLMAAGYVNGRGTQVDPKATTNRAEAAVFLYRIATNK